MEKIELYTCESGLELLKLDCRFGAWTESSRSFHEAGENFKILVNKKDITKTNLEGEYDLISIESVEVI